MSFESLNKDELKAVADFFNKEIKAADEDKGPTKKELVAGLASDEDGSDPVTWDDYKEVYLESDVKKEEERQAAIEETQAVAAADVVGPPAEPEDDDDEDHVLIRMDRKNGTYETHGLRFTKDHPYKSVPEKTAESILKTEEGFRLAMPSEVKDYYN